MEICLVCRRPGEVLRGRPWVWETFKNAAPASKVYRDVVSRARVTGEAFRLYRQTKGRLEPVRIIHYSCYRKILEEKATDVAKREKTRPRVKPQGAAAAAPMWCPECEAEVDSPEPAYECAECGAVFSESMSETGSNRCSCGRFAPKITDGACPECGTELEPPGGSGTAS